MDKTIYHKKRGSGATYYLVLTIWILSNITSLAQESKIRLLFVGDILLSRNVAMECGVHKESPWKELITLFKEANLVIGNLEGAVGDSTEQLASTSKSPVFPIPYKLLNLLPDAGFNAITIENNHSTDLGSIAKKRTIDSLFNKSITPIYLDNSPQFKTINNLVIAIVAINLIPDREYNKSEIPSIQIEQKMRMARTLADVLIVSIHWGSELLDWPNQSQRNAASWLVKQGADLIIGSHPHVIQQPEMIDGKPVFFSLGNHLFDQKYPTTKEGMIADITIENNKIYCKGILTHTKPNSFYPKIVSETPLAFDTITIKSHLLKVNQYTFRPISVPKSTRTILAAYTNNQQIWATHPMPLLDVSSYKFNEQEEYLFTLETHYSSLDKETTIRPYVYATDDKGIYAKWRGSALAWPLLDAIILPTSPNQLQAIHRGDSFLSPDKNCKTTRVATYQWNGFGFKGVTDSISIQK